MYNDWDHAVVLVVSSTLSGRQQRRLNASATEHLDSVVSYKFGFYIIFMF